MIASERSDTDEITSLIRALESGTEPDQAAAALLLSYCEDWRGAEALLRVIQAGGDLAVTVSYDLHHWRGARRVPILAKIMSTGSDTARGQAAIALANIEGPRALGVLYARRNDPSDAVRAFVAWAFGDSRDPRAVSLLSRYLNDRSFWVRTRAADGLALQRSEPSAKAIAGLLSDENQDVRLAALAALESLKAAEQLETAAAQKVRQEREAAKEERERKAADVEDGFGLIDFEDEQERRIARNTFAKWQADHGSVRQEPVAAKAAQPVQVSDDDALRY